mmetsp:Transcript_21939/g.54300  ORF Transcript_21939/g.54300 Transcript_21939/m.54300 type:complete len:114 (+) Transcript_21939:705-1046(+)
MSFKQFRIIALNPNYDPANQVVIIVVANPIKTIETSQMHDHKEYLIPPCLPPIPCPSSNKCKPGGRTKLTIDTAKQPTNAKTETKSGSLAATLTVPNKMNVRMIIIPFRDRLP